MTAKIAPSSALRTKVVHIVTLLELGGAQGNTIHTVRHLDPNHYDAHLWCGKGAYWDHDVKADLGAEGRLKFLKHLVRPVSPLHDVLAVFEIARELKRAKADIVHTHSSKAGIVGRLAAKLAGVPVIIHTFHGFGFNDRQSALARRLYVALERWAARFSTRLVFVSESNWKAAEKLRIGSPAKYVLIRSGVALQRLSDVKLGVDREEVRRELGIPAGARVVTTISAFKPQKNLADFVDAAAKISALCPEAFFLIVGDGEQRAALETRIEAKGLKAKTALPGWVPDPARLLAASDVFALTSLWEGLPRALVEAIALGVPAVCYEADGVRDLLKDPAELRKRGDVAGLAQSVAALLTDPAAARALAAAQGPRVTRDYDIVHMVGQQEMLYADLSRKANR